MTRLLGLARLPLLSLAIALWVAGCHNNQNPNGANNTQPSTEGQPQDQGQTPDQGQAPDQSDPASANLAPASYQTSGQQSAPPANATPDDDYGTEQPEATAPQPPPPLPTYQQPPAPAPDDLWTPGYWAWGTAGYYWVPGVWVAAPYPGALWTPGYWGYARGHYAFFRGYWGPHIGFYGGINYGFGYTGLGYQGGYWNNDRFYYNRSVNNVNTTVIRTVYNKTVINKTTIVNRVSYNGGTGGIRVRPRPAELAAVREQHAPPMKAQVEIVRTAATNHSNFASVNHGKPAQLVVSRALPADRNVPRPAETTAMRHEPAPRPGEARPEARPEAHPAPARREERTPARPEERRAPEARPEAKPEARPETHAPARPEEHPAPHAAEHPAPRTEEHATPRAEEHARPEAKPKPGERKSEPEKRPEEKRPQ